MKRILIVDDESLILYALSKALHSICPEVKTAVNGKEAIDEINSSFYDLCLLDIYLPDINGLDVMKKIKEISPRTRVAIMTASNKDADMQEALEGGAFHFVPKPFDISQIKAIAKEALEEGEDLTTGYKSHGAVTIKDRRDFERRALEKTINYSIDILEEGALKRVHLKCDIIDISYSGMGIYTDYPLEAGQVVRVANGIEYKVGIVKWSRMNDNKKAYRVGIKFL